MTKGFLSNATSPTRFGYGMEYREFAALTKPSRMRDTKSLLCPLIVMHRAPFENFW
jgi:hypothetical protein